MGSSFIPSGIYGAKLGAFAAILAETDAYRAFVGDTIADLGVAGMYFYGIDRREEDAAFPAAFALWTFGDGYGRYSTTAGGRPFKNQGDLVLTIEADTPAELVNDTPGAMDWIANHMQAMLSDMEALFGVAGRQEVSHHAPVGYPNRITESGSDDDYVGMSVRFTVRS